MESIRLTQFDVLKGIGILCVLLGHTEIPGLLKEQIYAFHMPLFFFCSGVFFRDRAMKDTILKCVRQLMIPYLFFLFIRYLCLFVLFAKDGDIARFYSDEVCTINILDEYCRVYTSIWFLLCLLWVRVLYALIEKGVNCIIDKHKTLITSMLYGGGYILALFIRLPFFIDTAIGMLIYYHLGRLFFASGVYEKTMKWPWIALMATIFVSLVAILHPYVEIKDCIYPFYHVLLAMLGILALYQICIKIRNGSMLSKWLARCGNASLSLLGLHRPLWLFVYPACLALSLSRWAMVLVQMILALVIILLADKILKRYTPVLIGSK